MGESIFNTPSNIEAYKGKFILFFSEDTNPEVLFSTFIAEEAFQKAEEIKKTFGREAVVIRVQENLTNNISQVLLTRI